MNFIKNLTPKQKKVLEHIEDRPFLTSGEIRDIANVHPNTVAMWRQTKKIKPIDKLINSYLYDKNEVLSFLDSRSKFKKGGGKKK